MCAIGAACLALLIWAAPIQAEPQSMGKECETRLKANGFQDTDFIISHDGRRDATLVYYATYWRDGAVDGSYRVEYKCSKRRGVIWHSWRSFYPGSSPQWSYWYPISGAYPEVARKHLPEE